MWLASPGHRHTFHISNGETFSQSDTLKQSEVSLHTGRVAAAAPPQRGLAGTRPGPCVALPPAQGRIRRGSVQLCVHLSLRSRLLCLDVLKARVERPTAPHGAKSRATFLKNMLSLRTKESHVKWLFMTAAAMTGSGPGRKSPIDKSF